MSRCAICGPTDGYIAEFRCGCGCKCELCQGCYDEHVEELVREVDEARGAVCAMSMRNALCSLRERVKP